MSADDAAERWSAGRPYPVFRFNPTKTDLERWLGPLETPIMEAMWRADYPRTVRGVWRELTQLGAPQAYTTVMTTMVRLWAKGMLNRSGKSRTYQYTTRETRMQFEERQIAAIQASIEEAVS
jgi:predicted transcriptional regulator